MTDKDLRPISNLEGSNQPYHHAFVRWRNRRQTKGSGPSHILHVDKHHDMMDQRQQANIANFIFHAMRIWPQCRAHCLVDHPIDSPAMWLEEDTWNSLRRRFSYGSKRPAKWPKPNVVSVCTSPDFVIPKLAGELIKVVSEFMMHHHKRRNRKQPLWISGLPK